MPVNFVIVLMLFNMAGVTAARVLLTLYAIKLGAQPVDIGILGAAFGVIPILFSWQSGRLADRFGSRWLMLFGFTGSASGLLLPYFMPSLAAIYVAGLLNGLALTFCNVSMQNLVGILSTPEKRAKNFSNFSLAGASGSFAGPLIAGFFIDYLGYVNACLYVVALAMVPSAMLVLRGGMLPRGSGQAAPSSSLRHLLAMPGVWQALIVSGISQFAADLFQVYMPVYAHAAGLSPSATGIVLAAYAAAAFFVRIWLPRLIARSNEETVLAYALGIGAFAYLLVPFFGSAGTITLTSFVLGLGLGCTRPIAMSLMFMHSPQGRSGEAMGLRLVAENATRVVGPVVFGLIASAAGLSAVFWISALMLGSGSMFLRRGAASHGK